MLPNKFTFSSCTYSVQIKSSVIEKILRRDTPTKTILSNVSAEVASGTDLAIMGPSGSGKSTLLNLLTLAPAPGHVCGRVTINGHKISAMQFRKFCAYVPQEDHLCPFLTCREILEYAIDFYMKESSEIKRRRVEDLLADLGLESCQQTPCGNQFFKGLSGGQKRRLSLAVALAKEPQILFLDEPTSGLDSAATSEITAVLRKIKVEKQIILICTIHQPSTRVLNEFDSVLLLSDGCVAFFGPTSQAVRHFLAMGFVMSADDSASEFLLDLVNSDFGGEQKKQQVATILSAWAAQAAEPMAPATALPARAQPGVPFFRQVLVHLRRQALLSVRDPTLYAARAAIFFVACIFFAWVYSKARARTQEVVTDRMFLTVWMISVPSCLGTVAVYSFNQELGAIRREIKDGMYSPWAYVVSNALLQPPFMVLLSLAALPVGAYGVARFEIVGFGRMLAVFSAALWAFEAMAQAVGALFRNPLAGMLVYLLLWFTSFLFSGFFIVGENIPWPLKAFLYVLPLRWSISSMVKTEFRWSTFDGAELAPPAPNATYSGFVCSSPPDARQVPW
jgi:ABC-type multidrug transport system ATPase subunit